MKFFDLSKKDQKNYKDYILQLKKHIMYTINNVYQSGFPNPQKHFCAIKITSKTQDGRMRQLLEWRMEPIIELAPFYWPKKICDDYSCAGELRQILEEIPNAIESNVNLEMKIVSISDDEIEFYISSVMYIQK